MAFIEPCFGIGHNLSLICQMTSEDIKHQLIIIVSSTRITVCITERKKLTKYKSKCKEKRKKKKTHDCILELKSAFSTNFN